MRGDEILADAVAQMPRNAFRHPPRVHEYQRRPVGGHELRQAVVVLLPHLVGHHGAERRLGNLEREIDGPPMALVDDGTLAAAGIGAHEKAGDGLDGPLRRRQPDPLKGPVGNLLEPFEGQGEVRTAARADDGVNFVDDDRARRAEEIPAPRACEHQIQRLGRGDEDVRGTLENGGPFGLRRVAGAYGSRDVGDGVTAGFGELADAAPRLAEILVDVGAQRLQRRDVHDTDLVRQRGGSGFANEIVDGDQERGERLSRAGRRSDERMSAVADGLPSTLLGGRRLPECVAEPFRDERMKG